MCYLNIVLFIYSSRISYTHTIYIYYICYPFHPPVLPNHLPPHPLLNLTSLYNPLKLVLPICCLHVREYGAIYWNLDNLLWVTLLKKTASSFSRHQLSIPLPLRMGPHDPLLSMLKY